MNARDQLDAMNVDYRCETDSPQQTARFGAAIGRSLVGGLWINLIGPLGAGKTQLVKGIAEGNAPHADPEVTSPTFTLVHEYPGRFTLLHVDAYRLRGADEFRALGPDEWLRDDTVVVIEWADRVRSALGDEGLWITLSSTGETNRVITARGVGEPACRCLDRLRRHVD